MAALLAEFVKIGALTHGDRRAVGGSSIQNFAVDEKYGSRALDKLLDCLEVKVYPMEDPDFISDVESGYDGRFEAFATRALDALKSIGVDRKLSPNQFLNRFDKTSFLCFWVYSF